MTSRTLSQMHGARTGRTRTVPVFIGMFFGLAMCRPGVAGSNELCRQSAGHVGHSCEAGAKSDYLLALGKCDNLADKTARKACRDSAANDRDEALQLCDDQEGSREQICHRLGGGPYDPIMDPANFVETIDNPYYPLMPGTTFVYEGPTPGGIEHRELTVTANAREILGVQCVEVHDVVLIDGALEEDTLDWFAQDTEGNVWYFGENSKQIADGLVVGIEGTWLGGVDGAKPGIIMKAQNSVGDFYRQEFSLDTAEDLAEVQALSESVTVPYGSFTGCLKTLETTPLNLSDVSNKLYCPGIGEVLTQDLPEPDGEKLELIDIRMQ